MASRGSALHFLIDGCPGPFKLVSGWVHMLEKHGNHLVFELTVKPVELGIELLGHHRSFKIPFEAVLMGATVKYSHGIDEPRNIRMLGRFLITDGVQRGSCPFVDPQTAAAVMNGWQWEVVFNAGGARVGFVAKLDSPLPEDWTL